MDLTKEEPQTAENAAGSVENAGSEPENSEDIIPKGTLHHKRVTPLPTRIKSGTIGEDTLQLESAHKLFEIPWAEIEYVALGMIQEKVEQDATAYKMQKLVESSANRKNGSIDSKTGKLVSYKPTYILDIYCRGRNDCLRFDAAYVSYRSFLGKNICHVSFQNFFRMVHDICSRCTQAYFTKEVAYFLTWNRDKLKFYDSLNDFENDIFILRSKTERFLSWEEMDFSRSSWADGWES
ncbi:hypothetical protein IJT93_05045 [bacterium]|nr:hypothetical protein [bacterium]